ncbi:MAG TPA: hypothetical protein VNT03_03235 [Baekduia sp.]|nr:hypothetical protein [Baekduia sp.]
MTIVRRPVQIERNSGALGDHKPLKGEMSVVVVGGRAAMLSSLRSLRVVLPSGEAYP